MNLKIATNRKYLTPNPVARRLLRNYVRTFTSLLKECSYTCALEVGCGEGVLLRQMRLTRPDANHIGLDISWPDLKCARENAAGCGLVLGTTFRLPFPSRCFDLVVCCEVLEHLAEPSLALTELTRVSRRHLLLSVPLEPLWRVMNICRGAYLHRLGNTPGHVNHWSRAAFVRFVSGAARIDNVVTTVPWTFVRARVRT